MRRSIAAQIRNKRYDVDNGATYKRVDITIQESVETTADRLAKICLTEDMADVFFSFQNEKTSRIPAHKMILALRSPVFKAMFYGSFPQSEGDISIEDISLNTFKRLMGYLYTDHLQLTKDSVIALLYAAKKYQIAGLISKCETYLQDNLDVSNACSLFSNAKFFTMEKLKINALKFISENAIEVLKNEDFLLLPSEDLVDILKLDSLCVPEIDVFRAVLKWVDNELTKNKTLIAGKSRRAYFLKDGILFTIGIPLLSLEEYTSVVIPSGVLTDEEQLQSFKAITIPNNASTCEKFRKRSRIGCKVTEISIDDILYPCNHCPKMNNQWVYLQSETLSMSANRRIKIKSISINPRFQQHKMPNNCRLNFNIKIDTVTNIENEDFEEEYDGSDVSKRNEEGTNTVNVTFEGRVCKVPIDRLISETEKLELTIRSKDGYQGGIGASKYMIARLPYVNPRSNDMMYQHKLSQQTTLFLSLTDGYLLESFEVIEMC
ncbi:BTB/POZ domain-containing protein 9 [Mytilus galloprovincialis]|uniref:BTB/POZ domain-containing protein 9 n=1 Tax=Mytilus galloprovincialis TaxID=29158 RepID=A0A8B6BEB6_MYTGA|nr:BTB/POZ domain-containing protein 9 [Mytilus galloprovincialis]